MDVHLAVIYGICAEVEFDFIFGVDRVPEEVPEEVAQLINECLSYDPKLRPSAKQIYDRLQASAGPLARPHAPSAIPATPFAAAAASGSGAALQPADNVSGSSGHNEPKAARAEVLQKMPTPLGSSRLPVRSAFETDD